MTFGRGNVINMPDIEVDPEVMRADAARLAEVADRLAWVAAALRDWDAAGVGRLGAGLAIRHAELVAAVCRDAGTLALTAGLLRREAEALGAVESDVQCRMGAIGRSLG